MRIEIWTPPLARLSGGNLYDQALAEGLKARGHQVRIREFGTGAEPHPDFSPQVVLQDELFHREFLARNRALVSERPRIVALVHHLMSDEPERSEAARRRLRQEEAAYLQSVDAVLAPSRATVRAARRLAGRKIEAAVAPPGRDRFAGSGPPPLLDSEGTREETREGIRARAEGPLRAVFLGNLIPRKRLLELLEAISRVPEWTLAVAGRFDLDPGYAARARFRARAPDLAGRVRFHGRLDAEQVATLLHRSCLTAVPSTHEGFGIAYLDGFAFGLPALAAASGGAPEIVSEGETGWLIPQAPPRETAILLAGHLETLRADRAKLAAMGIRADERYRAHPTWAESLEAVEDLLTGAGA